MTKHVKPFPRQAKISRYIRAAAFCRAMNRPMKNGMPTASQARTTPYASAAARRGLGIAGNAVFALQGALAREFVLGHHSACLLTGLIKKLQTKPTNNKPAMM